MQATDDISVPLYEIMVALELLQTKPPAIYFALFLKVMLMNSGAGRSRLFLTNYPMNGAVLHPILSYINLF